MLTRSGVGLLIGAFVAAAGGWRLGYTEVSVVAVMGIVAVAISWSFARRAPAVVATRINAPERVARGDSVRLRTQLVPAAGRPLPTSVLRDRFGSQVISVAVGGDDGGGVIVTYGVTAAVRGVIPLGPVALRRGDPLGLAVGEHRLAGGLTEVLVHPRFVHLHQRRLSERNAEVETARRRGASDPSAGFQSLRPYAPGDDTRTIHWPTTARTGTLMVREYTSPTRPSIAVVLLTNAADYQDHHFEDATDIAASIGVTAIRQGLDVVVVTSDPAAPGRAQVLRTEAAVLDLLARCQPTDGPVDFATLVHRVHHVTSAFVICGRSEEGLERLGEIGSEVVYVTVADTEDGQPRVIGVRADDVVAPTVDAFATWWRQST